MKVAGVTIAGKTNNREETQVNLDHGTPSIQPSMYLGLPS